MPHWIIDDKGFGGCFYRCSDCGESLCDIFDKNAGGEKCPKCDTIMDEDYEEYVEDKTPLEKVKEAMKKLGSIPPIHINCSYDYKRDGTNIHKLEQVSGESIEKLIELFAAGWTLEPPKSTSCSLGDLFNSLDLEE